MNQKIPVLVSDDDTSTPSTSSGTETSTVTETTLNLETPDGESEPSGTVDTEPGLLTIIAEDYPAPSTFTTQFYHKDHLGTPRAVTDSNGNLLSKHDYTPFGYELATTYHINTHKFTGHERDRETGLEYFIARYMNLRDCRFTHVDPIKGSAGSPQSWNAYTYAASNPMKYIDPSGMKSRFPLGPVAMGAGITLASFESWTYKNSDEKVSRLIYVAFFILVLLDTTLIIFNTDLSRMCLFLVLPLALVTILVSFLLDRFVLKA